MKALLLMLVLLSVAALVYCWLVARDDRRRLTSGEPPGRVSLAIPRPGGLSRSQRWPVYGFWGALAGLAAAMAAVAAL